MVKSNKTGEKILHKTENDMYTFLNLKRKVTILKGKCPQYRRFDIAHVLRRKIK